MKESNFFVRTKLLPPRAGSELLERPRLIERLQANLENALTMVAADAGCGKTTLIADFIRRQKRPAVWYQLDHTDADPAVFLTYIAHGIQSIAPKFGDAIFTYLSEAGEDILRAPERAADLLTHEILQSVDEPFIIVLDDYHHIGHDTPVHKLVDRFIQYSSELLHLIITTRDLPPLAITRRRSQSAALVLSRDDLLFNDAEVRELFQRTLNIELDQREVADYRERTNGWITALQLVRQVAEQRMHSGIGGGTVDLGEILKQSERDIFDYFAEEVFARETPEVRNLLLRLSLLESLDLDTCGRLFAGLRCSASLPQLAQKNVFLTVATDGRSAEEYRFHPLFREFLRRRLRAEIGQAGVSDERNRIAEYYINSRQWDMAIPYLLDAQNFDRSAEVIAQVGGDWIAAGAFTTLSMFADRVPTEALEEHPRSLLYKAETARLTGEIDQSSNLLLRAVALFEAKGETENEAEALHSLASLARRRGRYDEAYELLAKVDAIASVDSETFIKAANTRGLCLIVQGKLNEAEQQFRAALDAAEKQKNERYIRLVTHNLALAPGFRGDFGEALRWFKRIFRNGQPEKQLPQEAIGHLNVARLHIYRGEFDDAEMHLERAHELCQLYNMRSLRGEIFEAYGNFYREKGDLVRAGEFYERAAGAYDEAEIDPSTKELDEERAIYFLLRGEPGKARGLLERLINARELRGDETGTDTGRLRLMQVDLAQGRIEGLGNAVSVLSEKFRSQNHYYFEALASMVQAEALFLEGRPMDAVVPVMRALDLSARMDYDHWLRREIRRHPDIFALEEIAERLPADLRSEIASGKDPLDSKEESTATTPSATGAADLTIRVLGHVEILRDPEKPFAADAWTTRRARDIFCYIATSKYRRAAKDILIDVFWPDEDPAAVEKNFHPTISHIRKGLNSRQTLKQNFLMFRDGSYQLNPELSYAIDCEDFERLIAEAEVAKRERDQTRLRRALEGAYGLYRGEFMSGVYESWVEERRAFYAEQFDRVVSALAKLSFAERKWSSTLRYASEVLKDDPFREDMHRLTMKALAAQSKPAAVKKHFENLEAVLKLELGVEPSAETRKLFQELISQ